MLDSRINLSGFDANELFQYLNTKNEKNDFTVKMESSNFGNSLSGETIALIISGISLLTDILGIIIPYLQSRSQNNIIKIKTPDGIEFEISTSGRQIEIDKTIDEIKKIEAKLQKVQLSIISD
jgi:hypothetical protein